MHSKSQSLASDRQHSTQNPKSVVVLGAGAWGTTLASLAAANGHRVQVRSRRDGAISPSEIERADVVVSAVSMQGVATVVREIQTLPLLPATIFVTATKGLDPVTTLTPAQIWQATFPDRSVVVLCGPNLAKEIQQGLPAATVAGSTDDNAAVAVQAVFSSPQFRVYTNSDPLGVELGGTLKNVMAIAAGVCDGLQLGTNAKAALVTRGLTEIIRIGNSWGAKTETFYGLSGLGDLLATCNSPLSRNYQVGYQLAQGKTLPAILAHLEGTAEGVNTTQVLMQRARQQDIYMPITAEVYRLLQAEITPKQALEALMLRDLKSELL
ncbi:glycerol-3-phosphate dehydrogenase [cyanobacterium TDX16]|nr:glycerol-3-phosphate dehydrogenase [cyanobacterium TDX16]